MRIIHLLEITCIQIQGSVQYPPFDSVFFISARRLDIHRDVVLDFAVTRYVEVFFSSNTFK